MKQENRARVAGFLSPPRKRSGKPVFGAVVASGGDGGSVRNSMTFMFLFVNVYSYSMTHGNPGFSSPPRAPKPKFVFVAGAASGGDGLVSNAMSLCFFL